MFSRTTLNKFLPACLVLFFAVFLFWQLLQAEDRISSQAIDVEYTRLIKEATTKPELLQIHTMPT